MCLAHTGTSKFHTETLTQERSNLLCVNFRTHKMFYTPLCLLIVWGLIAHLKTDSRTIWKS
jgi:hypothetical protein